MSAFSMRHVVSSVAVVGIIAVAACSARDSSGDGEAVVATPTFDGLGVPVGIALIDPRASLADRWCANFDEYAMAVGDTVTLVWADSSADSATTTLAQVRSARGGRCARVPGDTSNIDDAGLGTVYELAPINSVDSTAVADLVMPPAIAVRGHARWLRGPDGFLRADLDGDENLEQARICTSHEGVHLTLWTLLDSAPAGKPREHLRWRAYQSLGYDVEPSCTEREMEDPPELEESHG